MLFLTHPCAETPQTIDRISNTHRGLDSLRPLSRPNKILASAVFDKFWFAPCGRFVETLQGGVEKNCPPCHRGLGYPALEGIGVLTPE